MDVYKIDVSIQVRWMYILGLQDVCIQDVCKYDRPTRCVYRSNQ